MKQRTFESFNLKYSNKKRFFENGQIRWKEKVQH